MAGPNYQFWECVEKMDAGRAVCKFCDLEFGKGTTISRIKSHLSGLTGRGIRICNEVPEEIKDAARAALDGNVSSRMPTGEDLVGAQETTGEATQTEDQVHHLVDNPWDVIAAAAHLMETRGDLISTSSPMLKGGAFVENTRKIWSWIMNDEISTIGIYGMGLVGKTEMLKHIHNELLQSQDISHRLYWVNVPQEDFSIETLQNLIAKRLDLVLSSEDDIMHRATKLSKELTQKQKWILILDDLWDDFEPHVLGIPVSLEGCKLIISTRSEEICLKVTDRSIRVNPLSNKEALKLFMKKLGHNIELSSEKKRIAECIVEECGGLPQGIIAMAGSMKRLRYNRQWDIALKELEQSRAGESHMEKVFTSLKSSYTRLKKYHQKAGFLYCALFPKAFVIPKDDLIAYLIDEGVIRKQESREAEFCIGHSLLDRLEDVCLLESINGGSAVKMHCLIRDMAIETYQEYFPVIIKAGVKLKSLSGAEEWGEKLVRVSLIENQIKEIPSRHSPSCPSLSTLLLHYNRKLELIADTFFEKLHGLKILDLSYTDIVKMPDSVSNLVRLTALLLVGCEKLRHVPSLENLREMRRLDLYRTALEDIPLGLEFVSELRYLRMNSRGEKEFPGGILRKLSRLQVFILGRGQQFPMTVKGEDVGCLEKLEDLECHFKSHSDLEMFLNSRDKTRSLKTYKIYVGQIEENDGCNVKTAISYLNSHQEVINRDSSSLVSSSCFCSSPLPQPSPSSHVIYSDLEELNCFGSSSWFCSSPLPQPSPSYNGIFSGLKELYCFGCTNTKKLLPHVSLQNLEVIEVNNCEKMEEIIERRSDNEGLIGEESSRSSTTTDLELPKLRDLKLIKLPELKSIFSAKLICHSLRVIHVRNCAKLKRMPICLPLLENGQLSPPPSLREIYIEPEEWWETEFKWEQSNAKNVLRHLVKFKEVRVSIMLIPLSQSPLI
jgi:disease resistance protein RPS2